MFDELKSLGFVVLAVAMDHADAARPWIDGAQPGYPCLIDRDHHVADLYNLVNVPQAVWIDENGRIVRPPENAGSTDGFRAMDRTTFAMPQQAIDERNRVKSQYLNALRDWARRGENSAYVLDAVSAAAKLIPKDPAIAMAHARFRLGQYLLREGRADEAQAQFTLAIELHPDSWNIWRQTAEKNATGLAAGPEFWARVDALGDRPYHRPIDMRGVPPAA
jgi:AhpC/TSA family